jgi:hypothetical protein
LIEELDGGNLHAPVLLLAAPGYSGCTRQGSESARRPIKTPSGQQVMFSWNRTQALPCWNFVMPFPGWQ